jgi:hypothetical protein
VPKTLQVKQTGALLGSNKNKAGGEDAAYTIENMGEGTDASYDFRENR